MASNSRSDNLMQKKSTVIAVHVYLCCQYIQYSMYELDEKKKNTQS
jgi:hypothetical protein